MFFVFGLSFSFKPSPMLILLSSRSSLRLSIHCSVGLLFCSFPGSLCAELQTTQYDHRLFSILHTCPIKPSQYVSSDPFYCVIFQPDSLSDIYFFIFYNLLTPVFASNSTFLQPLTFFHQPFYCPCLGIIQYLEFRDSTTSNNAKLFFLQRIFVHPIVWNPSDILDFVTSC